MDSVSLRQKKTAEMRHGFELFAEIGSFPSRRNRNCERSILVSPFIVDCPAGANAGAKRGPTHQNRPKYTEMDDTEIVEMTRTPIRNKGS